MLRSGRVLLSDEEPEIEEGLGRSANEDQASVWSMVLSDEDAESLLYGDNRFIALTHMQCECNEGTLLTVVRLLGSHQVTRISHKWSYIQ